MPIKLNSVEIRIIACLIEKQLTTPDYYPLTVNSLMAACNQKSNRDPVMQLTETEVQQGLSGLIEQFLVREKELPGTRAAKYEHKLGATLTQEYNFNQQQLAVLAVLLLRGPQTLGEIKTRTQRMADFTDLGQIETCLQSLTKHQKGAFVAALPREAGRREVRYTHLMSEGSEVPLTDNSQSHLVAENNQHDDLQLLRNEFNAFKTEFKQLKQQVDNLLNSGR